MEKNKIIKSKENNGSHKQIIERKEILRWLQKKLFAKKLIDKHFSLKFTFKQIAKNCDFKLLKNSY